MRPVGRFSVLLSSVVILLLLGAGWYRYYRNSRSETHRQTFTLMGTYVDIQAWGPRDTGEAMEAAITRAREEMESFVRLANRFDEHSEVSEINRMAGRKPVVVSPAILGTLKAAKEIGKLSDGAFDVTFLAVGKLWSLKPEHPVIPSDDAIQKALGLVNYQDLILDEEAGTAFLRREGMLLDLGGIAKGTAVDIAIHSLKGSGIENGLVNAGGDIYALGRRPDGTPWRVGIQDPRRKGELLGELRVSNRSVTTSGDYENMVIIDGKRYHHIINPRTGKPTEGVISVTVVDPSTQEADGLATAVFVLGVEKGLALVEPMPDVEALVIDASGKSHPSSGFNALLAEGFQIVE